MLSGFSSPGILSVMVGIKWEEVVVGVLREVADGVRVPRLNWGEGIELPIFLFNILRLGLQKTLNALISSGTFHRPVIA